MMPERFVTDACVLLNFLATGEAGQLLAGHTLFTSPPVAEQAIYLVGEELEDGSFVEVKVDLAVLTRPGLLSIKAIEDEAPDLQVELALRLRDEDASAVVLAHLLAVPLATDDRKVRRVCQELLPHQDVHGTLELVRSAMTSLGWAEPRIQTALRGLRHAGNFAPPRNDPHSSWYDMHLLDD